MARPDKRRARPDVLWTIHDVAEYLHRPVRTLYDWNHKGTGPPSYRIGRTLRYDPRDVWEWMQENRE
ncbi:helix-turn-helix domain-containing protein [Saccharopolyspora sp. 6T]|nr:helix-turn-helix domain-containing protein [Saccharopolyspora sp. 6T]